MLTASPSEQLEERAGWKERSSPIVSTVGPQFRFPLFGLFSSVLCKHLVSSPLRDTHPWGSSESMFLKSSHVMPCVTHSGGPLRVPFPRVNESPFSRRQVADRPPPPVSSPLLCKRVAWLWDWDGGRLFLRSDLTLNSSYSYCSGWRFNDILRVGSFSH